MTYNPKESKHNQNGKKPHAVVMRPISLEALKTRAAALPPRPEGMDESEQRRITFMLKELVWDFEQNNHNYIVFYHRDNNWWQTGDNSMLIYYYMAARQLKLRNLHMRRDGDYNDKKWRYGYITVSRIAKVVTNLSVLLDYKMIVDTENLKIFKLARPVTEDDLEIWRNTEQEKERRFNTLVMPKNVFPNITSQAAVLHREVVNKVVNLPAARRELFGMMGAELIGWVSYYSIATANGRMDAKAFFTETIERLDKLNDWLAFVRKFNVFNMDTNIRIAEGIHQLREESVTELARIEKKQKKKKIALDEEECQ